MTRGQNWTVQAANLLAGGTGLVYGWMRYVAESGDPYSVVNHPWQPHLQHLHVLSAPLLVFAAGLIWGGHVWRGYRSGQASHRKSGVLLAAMLFPMIISGYAVQVSVDDAWRELWIWVHVATSCAWIATALIHPWLRKTQA